MKSITSFMNESLDFFNDSSNEIEQLLEQYDETIEESAFDQMCSHIATIVKSYLKEKKLKNDEKGFDVAKDDLLSKLDDKTLDKVKELVLESYVNEVKSDYKIGDTVGNDVIGFDWEVTDIKQSGLYNVTIKNTRTGEIKNTTKENVYRIDEDSEDHVNSYVNEAKVENEDDFREYAEKKLKAAFGDKYDDEKAQDTIDGIIKKADGKWDEAVGMIVSGLKEEKETNEE